ncbi:ATP-binding protein, partial [Asanoa sp. NPDC050611]|uniref:ATP-binding protein n=1 Tax=Asanoa sp. NPDC050611 TaxID=3157098 RepID=UPI0033D4DB20
MVEIVGRDDQIGVLETLLDGACDGRGSALVLRGEAGIGKSALLEHAVRAGRERGMRVLSVTGVQAEGQIPYAGLDHLLRPLRPVWSDTGSPYRLALEVQREYELAMRRAELAWVRSLRAEITEGTLPGLA